MSDWKRIGVLAAWLVFSVPVWGELRDPTEPYGFRSQTVDPTTLLAPTFDANSLQLSGIFIGPDGNSAVVNGRRLRIGEQIAGARLVTIEPQAIELDLEGKIIKVELLPISVKTPAMGLSGGGE